MPGRWSLPTALLLAFAACAAESGDRGGRGGPEARDVVLPVSAGMVHVVVFTSHECPIANAYAPTLRDLARRWPPTAVRWFVVHVDAALAAADAARHAAEYELPGTVLLDPAQRLAAELGATRTPEAAVVTPAGLAYRGRIDDQWRALGARVPTATEHDLADAIEAVLAGRTPSPPRGPTVGCLLPEPVAR
jgi:hypothetical protein